VAILISFIFYLQSVKRKEVLFDFNTELSLLSSVGYSRWESKGAARKESDERKEITREGN